MQRVRERLDFDAAAGEIRDGPRRYLLLRPDVLMGALRPLEASQREALLEAFAQSAREHGGESIRAYHATLRAAGGDPREADTALLQTTASAAADLGWGRWTLRRDGDTLRLSV
ncbi:MAG TPA: hypothetical protein VM491_08525, partial [Burkholderiaceae bacterium]|nr:hypothetical protein [Burkholderiaceae bacterium]